MTSNDTDPANQSRELPGSKLSRDSNRTSLDSFRLFISLNGVQILRDWEMIEMNREDFQQQILRKIEHDSHRINNSILPHYEAVMNSVMVDGIIRKQKEMM